jgi:hypothetical protein
LLLFRDEVDDDATFGTRGFEDDDYGELIDLDDSFETFMIVSLTGSKLCKFCKRIKQTDKKNEKSTSRVKVK